MDFVASEHVVVTFPHLYLSVFTPRAAAGVRKMSSVEEITAAIHEVEAEQNSLKVRMQALKTRLVDLKYQLRVAKVVANPKAPQLPPVGEEQDWEDEVRKRKKGQPSRFPGLCVACCKRHLHEAGGPKHIKDLCDHTKDHIEAYGLAPMPPASKLVRPVNCPYAFRQTDAAWLLCLSGTTWKLNMTCLYQRRGPSRCTCTRPPCPASTWSTCRG